MTHQNLSPVSPLFRPLRRLRGIKGFRRAAAERGVSASAFSHVIRGLEEALDVRLFHRTSRSVSLTQVGHDLLERLGPALGEVAEALDSARKSSGKPSGPLRINVPRVVNALVIEPIVGRFLVTYPDIKLEIVTFDGLVDIVAEGFDAGIRRDRRLAPGRSSTEGSRIAGAYADGGQTSRPYTTSGATSS